MSETKEKLATDNYSCPNCGGTTAFNPASQKLECPYCFSKFDLPKTVQTEEKQLSELLVNAKVWNNAEVIQCENCGSKQVVTEGEIATHCAFCGTTNIVRTSEIVGMTPHGICPFQKSIDEASKLATAWAKKKIFAPRAFKKSAEAKSLKGLYTPAFTFDCDTITRYSGVLGEREQRVSYRNGRRETSSYMRYFNISGTYNRNFDDLLVHASNTIPSKFFTDMEPFPTGEAVTYDQKYLAGYTASTYSKDGKQTWADCKVKASGIIKKEILKKYDHDTVSKFNADTDYLNTSFKYLLLPVYIGHHAFKKKTYNFYVNGATGKVSGKAPVSKWKVFFAVLGGIALVTAIVALNIFFG